MGIRWEILDTTSVQMDLGKRVSSWPSMPSEWGGMDTVIYSFSLRETL